MSTPTKLVGVHEIAALLGITRQRVDQLTRDDPHFPPPIATLHMGRIWHLDDIQAWARATGRM